MRLRASEFVYLPIGGALAAGLLTSAIVLPQAHLAASQDCYGDCASTTSLALPHSTISRSEERLEEFSVRVGAGAGRTGVPTGGVAVEVGGHVICRIHLTEGTGDCSLGSDQLPPGSYGVAASYSGDSNFKPSTSAERHLVVLAPTGTELALSETRTAVPVSREWEEEFRFKVYEDGRPDTRPTGTVAVTTEGHVVCESHLTDGLGECSLRGYELHPGSYEVQAEYSGNAELSPSVSHEKHLAIRRG